MSSRESKVFNDVRLALGLGGQTWRFRWSSKGELTRVTCLVYERIWGLVHRARDWQCLQGVMTSTLAVVSFTQRES